jgi:hypothetical protein
LYRIIHYAVKIASSRHGGTEDAMVLIATTSEVKDTRMERRQTTIGAAVDSCIVDATEEWFRQHAGMRTREEAAANDIRKVNVVIERLPHGRLQVSVTIVATTVRQTQNAYYRYQSTAKLGYVPVAGESRVVV